MLEFIFLLLFGAVLLFIFSRTVCLWVLSQFLGYIHRRVQERYTEGASAQGADRGQRQAQSSGQRREKMDIRDIEAKRFEKSDESEYTDFEELPK